MKSDVKLRINSFLPILFYTHKVFKLESYVWRNFVPKYFALDRFVDTKDKNCFLAYFLGGLLSVLRLFMDLLDFRPYLCYSIKKNDTWPKIGEWVYNPPQSADNNLKTSSQECIDELEHREEVEDENPGTRGFTGSPDDALR